MESITPTIMAMLAFNLGPPGALIKREKLGLMNAARPIIITIIPATIRIVLDRDIYPP